MTLQHVAHLVGRDAEAVGDLALGDTFARRCVYGGVQLWVRRATAPRLGGPERDIGGVETIWRAAWNAVSDDDIVSALRAYADQYG